MVGAFRTPDEDPEALERRIEATFGETATWAFGGGAAAMRLTGFYRGPETVLHVVTWRREDAARLRAVRATRGGLMVLKAPGEIVLQGVLPQTVHPLLIYTELLTAEHQRAREAAEEIRRSYLQP
jgi:hypothetical protein